MVDTKIILDNTLEEVLFNEIHQHIKQGIHGGIPHEQLTRLINIFGSNETNRIKQIKEDIAEHTSIIDERKNISVGYRSYMKNPDFSYLMGYYVEYVKGGYKVAMRKR